MSVSKSSSIANSINLIRPLAALLNMSEYIPSSYSFNHTRIYKDNRAFVLCNQNDWFLCNYMQEKSSTILSYDYFEESKKQFVWNRNPSFLKDRANLVATASQYINIEASVMIQVKNAEFSDRFVFADHVREHHFIDRFINHPTLMDDVINKYYEKTEGLLAEAESQCFLVSDPITEKPEAKDLAFPTEAANNYLSRILDQPVTLTEKEYYFLLLIIYGIKPKAIAKRFHLSHRTVENRIQAARIKLQCASALEVAALFHKSGAFKLYFEKFCRDI